MINKVYVYVEGQSDKNAMMALLHPLIEQKRLEGIEIAFFYMNGKGKLLIKGPKRAVETILQDPNSIAVIIPDLYPKNTHFTHETFEELKNGILHDFKSALQEKHIRYNDHLMKRFKVFCFKYDLEALILASKKSLESHLGVRQIRAKWHIPVEDQNHDNPPKKIVERLFASYGKKYNDVTDARRILSKSDYKDVANKCSQCFKPFVDFLKNLPKND
jgi:hypothetical protein